MELRRPLPPLGASAAALAGAGVGRGDVVAIAMADRPQWVAVMLGAARIGAVCALASALIQQERLSSSPGAP